MEDLLTRVWDNLVARTEGPMNLRFVLQPCMSLFFAIRAGLADARAGAVPYLWRFVVSKDKRLVTAKEGWRDFGKIFIVGVTLDVVYQLLVIFNMKSQPRFYPLESLIVAACLAIVPYLLMRGPVSRLMSLLYKPAHRQQRDQPKQT